MVKTDLRTGTPISQSARDVPGLRRAELEIGVPAPILISARAIELIRAGGTDGESLE